MSKSDPVVVKTYNSPGDYSKDAPRMARQGYTVVSQSSSQKRGLINFLLFFWPRKTVTVVTYGRPLIRVNP